MYAYIQKSTQVITVQLDKFLPSETLVIQRQDQETKYRYKLQRAPSVLCTSLSFTINDAHYSPLLISNTNV